MVLLKGEIDGCFYDVLCVHIHVTHYVNEVENREKCKISHLPPPLMIKFFPSCFHGLFIAPYTLFLSYYSVNSKFWYNRFIRERVLVARGEKKHTREKILISRRSLGKSSLSRLISAFHLIVMKNMNLFSKFGTFSLSRALSFHFFHIKI